MKNAASITPREAAFGWGWLLTQLLLLPSLLIWLVGRAPFHISTAALNFLFYAINLLAVCLIFRRFLLQSLRDARQRLPQVLLAAALGLAGCFLGTRIVTEAAKLVQPDFFNINDSAIRAMGDEDWLLTAVGASLLVPVTEECFYRGLIFRRLWQEHRFAAYIVSAAVFSAVHVAGYAGRFSAGHLTLCFAQYLPAGLCLAGAYAFSGTIAAPILIHAAVNAWSSAALLF